MTTRYTFMDSPVGKLWIAWCEKGLVSVGFSRQDRGAQIENSWEYDENLDCEAIHQLTGYFKGGLKEFDLPLVMNGTEFQERVWQELASIPFGETITYGELAVRVGNPRASRAVGAANGQNPIAIVLPCHRVVGRDGKLTGYAGGIDIKEFLLRFEREAIIPGLPGILLDSSV